MFSSWLRLRGGHRAQPKVAKAMAGEAALRDVPKAKAGRAVSGPSGSQAMEGISDRGSSARSRGAERSRSRLVARRGSLRNGGRRAGRPATSCQRSCTGSHRTRRKTPNGVLELQAEVGACRESTLPIGRFRETRISPLAPARARVPVFENVDCTASVRRILVVLTRSSGRLRTTQPEISTGAALTSGRGGMRVKRVRESFSG
jgi:hypothetical protein